MKESFSSRFNIYTHFRQAVFTGLFMFIGLSTAISQNYLSDQEAVSVLRTEIMNATNTTAASYQQVTPALFQTSNPQFYAYLEMIQGIYKHLGTAISNGSSTSSSVRDAILYARDRGIQASVVNAAFYNQAFDNVTALLTN